MTQSKFTISDIHRITGKSRTTISKHMEEGKLSYEREGDKKLVDAAELMRVYGSECDFDRVKGKKPPPKSASLESFPQATDFAQQQLDNERKERERERTQYLNQIEHLQEALGSAQEGHNRATLLLENHSSGGGALQIALDGLEQRMSKQELSLSEEKALSLKLRKQNAQLKRAIRREREKSVWERIFGGSQVSSSRPANSEA
ncbi:hypothetical protein AAFN60_18620 [Roseibacillus persicicus]|uniref:hypothetical protein n=1 Tax=Roseibacillus persicicus TaxID=454148 RepID=UPI00398B1149